MHSVPLLLEEDNTQPRAYRPDDLPGMLALSRAMVYKLLRTGTIRSVRAGRRYIVPADAVTEFLNGSRPEAQGKADA